MGYELRLKTKDGVRAVDGKVILVTGAASGIGAATARMIEERGGIAVATDIQPGLEHVLDVTQPDHWDAAIEATVAKYSRIDGLVSNAGTMSAGSIIELKMDRFRALNRIHVEGAFLGIQRVVAQMRKQSSPAYGSIVITSSVMGQVPMPGLASYASAKAALSNMAKSIGVELGGKGDFIRVNAVAPGPVHTPLMVDAMPPGYMDDPASFADVPLGEAANADDVAETILFLLSDESSFMTGGVNVIDGGWSLS
jgi:NAD(P)-dependent dehydrogenase (short-subunit alcohol dehydrogenase family)